MKSSWWPRRTPRGGLRRVSAQLAEDLGDGAPPCAGNGLRPTRAVGFSGGWHAEAQTAHDLGRQCLCAVVHALRRCRAGQAFAGSRAGPPAGELVRSRARSVI